MGADPGRVVCDIGNSRMKWGRIAPDGRIAGRLVLGLDDPGSWRGAIASWGLDDRSEWAIATVNPPVARRFEGVLNEDGAPRVRWFRSAADVPLAHRLERPDLAGCDRALAVFAALTMTPAGGPGLVIQCGTAITVERVTGGGMWEGGAIGIGLGLASRALHRDTAQLPEIAPESAPLPWGNSTDPALRAGLFWGAVGSVRELVARQEDPGSPLRWHVWTGGDAARLAPFVETGPRVVPDLVLAGLAIAAFGAGP